jgi:hypothetical protein
MQTSHKFIFHMTFKTEQTSLNLQYITFLSVNKVNVTTNNRRHTKGDHKIQSLKEFTIHEIRISYLTRAKES